MEEADKGCEGGRIAATCLFFKKKVVSQASREILSNKYAPPTYVFSVPFVVLHVRARGLHAWGGAPEFFSS